MKLLLLYLSLTLYPLDRISTHLEIVYRPTLAGGFSRTGLFPAPPVTGELLMPGWTFRAKGRIYSSPVADAMGNIYVGSQDDNLYAISPMGSELWHFSTNADVDSTPTVYGTTVYTGSDDGYLYAIDTQSGQLIWKRRIGTCRSSAYVDSHMLVVTGNSSVYAFTHEGKPLWRVRLRGSVIYASISRNKHTGHFHVTTRNGFVYAISSRGDVLWTKNLAIGTSGNGTVVITPSGQLLVSTSRKLFALSSSGDILWTHEGSFSTVPALLPDGSIVAAAQNYLLRMSRTGKTVWRKQIIQSRKSINSFLSVDRSGNIYFGSRDDHVYGVSPSGSVFLSIDTGDDVDSTPLLLSSGTLIFGCDNGLVRAYRYTGTTAPKPPLHH